MFHYTDKSSYNAIRSQATWAFKAHRQRSPHLPFGAYFTPLAVDAPAFSRRTRIPTEKQEYVFSFADAGDLLPLDGDRGKIVFYSPVDYPVIRGRQHPAATGPTARGNPTGT